MESDVVRIFNSTARKHLVDEFLPKLKQCLADLSEDQIWWRPNENSNSVGNLILHLSGNIRQWIVSGLGGEVDQRERSAEFARRDPLSRNELLSLLEETVEEAVRVIDRLTLRDLVEKNPIQVYEVTGLYAVSHVVEHFSYHLGQIVYVTKMLRDHDLQFYDL